MSAAGVMLGLGLGGAALALFMARRSMKSSSSSSATAEELAPTGHREPITSAIWTPQTPTDVQDLLRTACSCVDAASRLEDEELALCIWAAHWPSVPFPEGVIDGDHPSVQEALDGVRASVKAARDGQCQQLPEFEDESDDAADSPSDEGEGLPDIELDPPAEPGPPPPILGTTNLPTFGPVTTNLPTFEPATTNLPTFEPATTNLPTFELDTVRVPIDMPALTRAAPTPGYFYQVRPGDRFMGDDGVIARALHQAVIHAARAKGWSEARMFAHATALAADIKARLAYLSIVQCGPWNDAMYGTWGYAAEDVPAAHGRAIRLIARHDRVYDRLVDGQAPIRTLDRSTPADKGTGMATGAGDMLELLWLPPLRSDALLDANRSRQVVAEGLVWADNSSKYNPPPSVVALGITNAPTGPWGCTEAAA